MSTVGKMTARLEDQIIDLTEENKRLKSKADLVDTLRHNSNFYKNERDRLIQENNKLRYDMATLHKESKNRSYNGV